MAFDFEIVGLSVKFFDRTTFVASTWAWDFGDGNVSAIREPTHTYADPGDYTVVLTATCGARTSSVSKTLHVTDAPIPAALAVSLSTPWLFGTEYGPDYGTDVVTDSPVAAIATGGVAPYSYAWEADTGFSFATAGIWPSSPNAAATTFSAQLESPSTGFTNWIKVVCKVTDAEGTLVTSTPVMVFLTASFDPFIVQLSTLQSIATGSTTLVETDPIAVLPMDGNYSYQWTLMTDDVRLSIPDDTLDQIVVQAAGLSLNETVLVGLNVAVTDDDSGDVVISDWVHVYLTANS